MGKRGRATVVENAGAADRTLAALKSVLEKR
jgi:hypothetical protein